MESNLAPPDLSLFPFENSNSVINTCAYVIGNRCLEKYSRTNKQAQVRNKHFRLEMKPDPKQRGTEDLELRVSQRKWDIPIIPVNEGNHIFTFVWNGVLFANSFIGQGSLRIPRFFFYSQRIVWSLSPQAMLAADDQRSAPEKWYVSDFKVL